MARMHARVKGHRRSTKKSGVKPAISGKDVEDLVVKYRKQDYSTSMIGIILRDKHGVPSVKDATGLKINRILAKHNLLPKFPEDLMNLMKRAVNLRKHLEFNPHDIHNKRSLQLIESKINRLVKYYHRVNRLPESWKYSYDKAKLLVE